MLQEEFTSWRYVGSQQESMDEYSYIYQVFDFIQQSNEETKQEKLLLLDNCPCHPCINDLSNVKLVFLPENTTSGTQPLDAEIIKNFKLHFRTLIMSYAIDILEDISERFNR